METGCHCSFDDAEPPFSFTFPFVTCQLNVLLSNTSPRIVGGGLDAVVGVGHTGWMRVRSVFSNSALIGAVLIANSGNGSNSFTDGHTLHKLTLTNGILIVPIFTPAC